MSIFPEGKGYTELVECMMNGKIKFLPEITSPYLDILLKKLSTTAIVVLLHAIFLSVLFATICPFEVIKWRTLTPLCMKCSDRKTGTLFMSKMKNFIKMMTQIRKFLK